MLPALLSGLEGVGLVLAFSPSGTMLVSAILTLPYDPAAVAALGLTERTLRFFVLEDGAQTWQEIPGVVDTATHLITVPLSSFSQGIAGAVIGRRNWTPHSRGWMRASHSQSSKATDPDGDALTLTASGLPVSLPA